MWRPLLALAAFGGLMTGVVLHVWGSPTAASAVWAVATGAILVPLTASVVRSLARRDVGVDAIALVAIASALAVGVYIVAAVVALMLAGGNALEYYAARRAGRELTRLISRLPRTANRRKGDSIEEVPVESLVPGDVVVMRAGEIVPVDGVVISAHATLDESALTGESLPIERAQGAEVRSGTANVGDVFDLRTRRPAEESAYAAIVRLVRGAQDERAPFVRLADRYAGIFLPITLAVAGAAWTVSGDATRFLAVMVVATPCPLILAAPIALISGVSRAAHRGVIVKGGGVIEQLGRARSVLFDKTGTLTLGVAAVEDVVVFDGIDRNELVRLAASLDQLSVHVFAEALVRDAAKRGVRLSPPDDVEESPGHGIDGVVDGRRVALGSSGWVAQRGYGEPGTATAMPGTATPGAARIVVGVDGVVAGVIFLADDVRADARLVVDDLRRLGIRHVAMVTGDRRSVAAGIGAELEVDRVDADLSPEGKLDVVRALRETPGLAPVVMVGDGVNDAPALAIADVGIAMGSAGATVSSEAADAVVTLDRIDRVADAVSIGRRSLGIARQSVLVGMGLSLAAMAVAAAGGLTPIAGALFQEGIDVAVILNSLRALREGRSSVLRRAIDR